MCQMNVIMEKDGVQKVVLENATQLEVVDEGVKISTFFDEPKLFAGVAVQTIDFLSGTLILKATAKVS